jgi:hypothetical protein
MRILAKRHDQFGEAKLLSRLNIKPANAQPEWRYSPHIPDLGTCEGKLSGSFDCFTHREKMIIICTVTYLLTYGTEPFLRSCQLCS